MEQPVKLKHEKISTQKSFIDRSGRQCIVHFDNLDNIKEDVGCLTESGFNKVKEVAIKKINIYIHQG